MTGAFKCVYAWAAAAAPGARLHRIWRTRTVLQHGVTCVHPSRNTDKCAVCVDACLCQTAPAGPGPRGARNLFSPVGERARDGGHGGQRHAASHIVIEQAQHVIIHHHHPWRARDSRQQRVDSECRRRKEQARCPALCRVQCPSSPCCSSGCRAPCPVRGPPAYVRMQTQRARVVLGSSRVALLSQQCYQQHTTSLRFDLLARKSTFAAAMLRAAQRCLRMCLRNNTHDKASARPCRVQSDLTHGRGLVGSSS